MAFKTNDCLELVWIFISMKFRKLKTFFELEHGVSPVFVGRILGWTGYNIKECTPPSDRKRTPISTPGDALFGPFLVRHVINGRTLNTTPPYGGASENSIKPQNCHTTTWWIPFTHIFLLCPKPQPPAPVVGLWPVTEHVACHYSIIFQINQGAMLPCIVVQGVGEKQSCFMIMAAVIFAARRAYLRCSSREFWHHWIPMVVPVTRAYGGQGSGACSVTNCGGKRIAPEKAAAGDQKMLQWSKHTPETVLIKWV